MIKFVRKAHVASQSGKIVIYYNISDIFLGTILMLLVIFFIHDYLSHSLGRKNSYYTHSIYMGEDVNPQLPPKTYPR